MLVREWMTAALVTVGPREPVSEAQRLMRHRHIRHLPVVCGERLTGIITDRDVRTAMPSPATTLAGAEVGYLVERLRVEHVMSRAVITIGPAAPVAEAVRLLLAHRVGALPVVDHGRLVGIITESDLLRAFAVTSASHAPVPPAVAAAAGPVRPERPPAILVPLDGSIGSESVLPIVGDLARSRGARVRLLRVGPEPPAARTAERKAAADEDALRPGRELLAYLERTALGLPGLAVEPVVRFGEVVDAIVREAQEAGVDMIAMATHRRRGVDRALHGSVAEAVERASAIPVVLVPRGAVRDGGRP